MDLSGIVVNCKPSHLDAVTAAVNALPWADVHHVGADGRMVVTLEGVDERESMDRLRILQQLPHIASAQMAEYRIGVDNDA